MNEKAVALQNRTKQFALDVLDFVETLPTQGFVVRIAAQLVASATSVAANYRAACRGRSRAEFAAKVGLTLEESDESLLWLEICDAKHCGDPERRLRLLQEADELTAIFTASTITARQPSRR
jgi:four helix bundle protein